MDRKLDVIWDEKAVMIATGSYSELGKLIPPTYDGRWKVIRHNTENLHPERGDYAVLCTVTEYARKDGILFLIHDGGYAPVDDRLLELMRSADAQNVRAYEELRRRLWAQHDKMEADADAINEGEAREGLDRVHFKANYAGGVGNYQGKGADFGAKIISP